MRAIRSAIAFACAGLVLCNPAWARQADPAVVRTGQGALRGIVSGDVVEFRGIPYAAAPVGDRRFAPPAESGGWSGIRDATRFAATCPQGQSFDEDCLTVNVTVPRNAAGRKLPVMVWLHGGGFSAGTPNSYGAQELAAQGRVIVVGVAFRLNVFGLMALPDMAGAGSLLLQDQQAALRWVRRHIAAFGGDAGNVTLFGESGGAIGTCAQLASPAAATLFDKAILQSGSCSTSFAADFVARGVPAGAYFAPLAAMEQQGVAYAGALGCAAADGASRLACLRRLPASAIAAQGGAFIAAAHGTATLPEAPARAIGTTDPRRRVPVLTGFTHQEGLAMVAGMALMGAPVTAAEYPALARRAFGDRGREVVARYPLAGFGGRGDLAWAAVVTDRMFACPQLRDAATLARQGPVFAYEFADPNGTGLIPMPPGLPGGASHSSDLPLLFRLTDGPLDLSTGKKIERSPAQQALSARMIAAWARFARTGDPAAPGGESWPSFDPRRPAATWLAPAGTAPPRTRAPIAHHCAFWASFPI